MTENQPFASEKAPSVFPVSLKWGLLAGVISILFSLYGYITESFGNIFLAFAVSLIISITIIVLAMREYRKANGGYMTYLQGLMVGILTMVIASLISGLFTMLYVQFVDPTIPEKMVDAALEQMIMLGVDDSVIEEQRDAILAENTPVNQLWGALKNGLIGGFILSLIISAIMKRSRPEFE
ncbi:DUF4199 domain-containing protein [Pontibacter litorisediminis]|uniref:DUF4199 domain-containing protein n=1 Tax=Pontibacter litorisediminis TaxID=1846260 RepID=UPI0023EB190D|nr:DUF4199 domain-containing protein [Pontibacter litorisediminis]